MESDDNATLGHEKAEVQAPEVMADWGQHLEGLKGIRQSSSLKMGRAATLLAQPLWEGSRRNRGCCRTCFRREDE